MTTTTRETQLRAALLKSLRWAMTHLLTNDGGEDEEAYAEAKAVIEAAEKYEREVEAGSK